MAPTGKTQRTAETACQQRMITGTVRHRAFGPESVGRFADSAPRATAIARVRKKGKPGLATPCHLALSPTRGMTHRAADASRVRRDMRPYRFYEKVVKVKAD